jgi:hypothetical protein
VSRSSIKYTEDENENENEDEFRECQNRHLPRVQP